MADAAFKPVLQVGTPLARRAPWFRVNARCRPQFAAAAEARRRPAAEWAGIGVRSFRPAVAVAGLTRLANARLDGGGGQLYSGAADMAKPQCSDFGV
jgi:hypothetical protein